MVKMKFREISNFQFAQAIQKIGSTPTHGAKASQIHKAVKVISRARETISKTFQTEISEKFGKKDEAGKLIRPEGEPNGFEPIEDQVKELELAQEAFGENVIELNCAPFTLALLEDMKVSAQDLEYLRGMYAGNAEDEVKPTLQSVK